MSISRQTLNPAALTDYRKMNDSLDERSVLTSENKIWQTYSHYRSISCSGASAPAHQQMEFWEISGSICSRCRDVMHIFNITVQRGPGVIGWAAPFAWSHVNLHRVHQRCVETSAPHHKSFHIWPNWIHFWHNLLSMKSLSRCETPVSPCVWLKDWHVLCESLEGCDTTATLSDTRLWQVANGKD